MERLKQELAGMSAKREGLARELAQVLAVKSELERELALLRAKQKEAEDCRKAAEDLTAYKNCIAQTQMEVRTALVDEINAAMAHIWPIIYPYNDCSGARISVDEKDYQIEINADGYKSVDRVASGGERACLALALRIAFATVLTPNLSWLILDEPTHNLDSEAVEMLGKALGEKIPSVVEQTFIITHDAGLMDAGIGRIYRLDRDKDKNEDTRVEIL
jgi:exonuclease SbcC